MRYSQLFIPTRREDPADAEVISHKLLVRAGYMRMLARGIYSFLPLGWKVIHKIEQIIREEMDRAGAQEVLLPGVQPSELWEESGRWRLYGPELLRFKDRKGADFCLGPTHEEVITDLVRGEVRSYKQLPLNLYQIQSKFRDEIRPRAGLMRGREFIMKDAYSFDVSPERAKASYQVMFDAYNSTFKRMGFEFRAVEADTGAIGGSLSHEFQVLAQSGEDLMMSCASCGFGANVEKTASVRGAGAPEGAAQAELKTVETPGRKTVDEVTAFLGVQATDLVKTILFQADERVVAVLIRGDQEVNEVKVKAATGADMLGLASEKTVVEVTGAPVGFAGPVGLGDDVEILADWSVEGMVNFVVGANARDAHHTGVNLGRDVTVGRWADLRLVRDGDPCPRCSAPLESYRGIEVGHVFYLGTKYSEAMGANFLDEKGDSKPLEMGCYGMGVTRIMAAVIEQNHDDDGIIWPMAMAPFQVILLPIGKMDDTLGAAIGEVYNQLRAQGIDVLLDDRDERPAVKFKDADLIGVPLRLTLGGRGLKNGQIEVKWRHESEHSLVALDEAAAHVRALIDGAMGR